MSRHTPLQDGDELDVWIVYDPAMPYPTVFQKKRSAARYARTECCRMDEVKRRIRLTSGDRDWEPVGWEIPVYREEICKRT